MTAASLREQIDGAPAGVVHVVVPFGCHSPRLAFLADQERVLEQLLTSRSGARRANGTVSWWEDEVAIRVDLADRATDGAPANTAGEPAVAHAAAAAPAGPSRPVAARRRRTSGTLNLSQPQIAWLERAIDLVLQSRPDGLDLDVAHDIAAKLERLARTAGE